MNSLDEHLKPESPGIPTQEGPVRRRAERRPYEKPQVIDHGRLSDVALGGSPGVGDSGNAGTELRLGG